MNRESPHPDASRDGPAGPSPVPGRLHIRQVEDAIRPALGAVVMASGVVSIDLYSDHRLVLSAITLWFALVVWLLLAVVVSVRLAYERARFAREASSPAGFTSVAATAVLGTRLAIADYDAVAAALLAVSGVCWALVVVPVLRHWKTPTVGISFVLTMATEALAVLGAILAVSYRADWLVSAAAAGAGSRARLLRLHRRPVRPARTGRGVRRPLDRGRCAGHLCSGRRPRHPSRSRAWTIKRAAPGLHQRHAGALVPGHGVALPAGGRRDPQAAARL